MPRPVRFACLAAVAVLAAFPATAAASGDPAEEQRGQGAFVQMTFNDPDSPGADDPTINNHLTTLIKKAPASATIGIAIFTLTAPGLTQALIDQTKDGQGMVYVVFDGTNLSSNEAQQLRDALNGNASLNIPDAANGAFVKCKQEPATADMGACLGHRSFSRQHAKYALISSAYREIPDGQTDTPDYAGPYANVTWIGSANPSGGGGWEAWNSAVTVYNDPTLYNDLATRMFQPQYGLAWGSDDFFNQTASPPRGYVHANSSNTTVWASPELETDLWGARMDEINPTSGPCTVRVLQGVFAEHSEDRDRGVKLANKLAGLKSKGCGVYVLIAKGSSGEPQIGADTKQILCNAGVSLRARKGIHEKSMIVNADYLGTEPKRIVFTGSHNFTEKALRNNDELIVRVGDWVNGALNSRFISHFNAAWSLTDGHTGQPCQ